MQYKRYVPNHKAGREKDRKWGYCTSVEHMLQNTSLLLFPGNWDKQRGKRVHDNMLVSEGKGRWDNFPLYNFGPLLWPHPSPPHLPLAHSISKASRAVHTCVILAASLLKGEKAQTFHHNFVVRADTECSLTGCLQQIKHFTFLLYRGPAHYIHKIREYRQRVHHKQSHSHLHCLIENDEYKHNNGGHHS